MWQDCGTPGGIAQPCTLAGKVYMMAACVCVCVLHCTAMHPGRWGLHLPAGCPGMVVCVVKCVSRFRFS
jgi:hypothetical protein